MEPPPTLSARGPAADESDPGQFSGNLSSVSRRAISDPVARSDGPIATSGPASVCDQALAREAFAHLAGTVPSRPMEPISVVGKRPHSSVVSAAVESSPSARHAVASVAPSGAASAVRIEVVDGIVDAVPVSGERAAKFEVLPASAAPDAASMMSGMPAGPAAAAAAASLPAYSTLLGFGSGVPFGPGVGSGSTVASLRSPTTTMNRSLVLGLVPTAAGPSSAVEEALQSHSSRIPSSYPRKRGAPERGGQEKKVAAAVAAAAAAAAATASASAAERSVLEIGYSPRLPAAQAQPPALSVSPPAPPLPPPPPPLLPAAAAQAPAGAVTFQPPPPPPPPPHVPMPASELRYPSSLPPAAVSLLVGPSFPASAVASHLSLPMPASSEIIQAGLSPLSSSVESATVGGERSGEPDWRRNRHRRPGKQQTRWVLSDAQQRTLEEFYRTNPYPTSEQYLEVMHRVNQLAADVNHQRNLKQIRQWFANQRGRYKSVERR